MALRTRTATIIMARILEDRSSLQNSRTTGGATPGLSKLKFQPWMQRKKTPQLFQILSVAMITIISSARETRIMPLQQLWLTPESLKTMDSRIMESQKANYRHLSKNFQERRAVETISIPDTLISLKRKDPSLQKFKHLGALQKPRILMTMMMPGEDSTCSLRKKKKNLQVILRINSQRNCSKKNKPSRLTYSRKNKKKKSRMNSITKSPRPWTEQRTSKLRL